MRWLRTFVFLVLLASTGWGAFLGARWWRFTATERALLRAKPAITLNSRAGDGAVHVTFKIWQGWIVVHSRSAGRPVDCMIDTGSSLIKWPRSLKLAGKYTGVSESGFEVWAGADPVAAEWVVLPDIALGDYHLRDCPTVAYGAAAAPQRMPIIGIAAFKDVRLTIDYRKRELVVTRSVAGEHPLTGPWLRLTPSGGVFGRYHGVPSVRGTVAGLPATFVLDTGAAPVRLALSSPALIDAVQRKLSAPLVDEPATARKGIAAVPWSVGGASFSDTAVLMPHFFSAGDAVLGQEFLKNYRVTIDFSQRQALLEPAVREVTGRRGK